MMKAFHPRFDDFCMPNCRFMNLSQEETYRTNSNVIEVETELSCENAQICKAWFKHNEEPKKAVADLAKIHGDEFAAMVLRKTLEDILTNVHRGKKMTGIFIGADVSGRPDMTAINGKPEYNNKTRGKE